MKGGRWSRVEGERVKESERGKKKKERNLILLKFLQSIILVAHFFLRPRKQCGVEAILLPVIRIVLPIWAGT